MNSLWSSRYASFNFVLLIIAFFFWFRRSQERVGILNTLKKEARITEAVLRVCLPSFSFASIVLTFCALRAPHCPCAGEQSWSCSRETALELLACRSRVGQRNSQEVEDRCRERKATWWQVAWHRQCHKDPTCVDFYSFPNHSKLHISCSMHHSCFPKALHSFRDTHYTYHAIHVRKQLQDRSPDCQI